MEGVGARVLTAPLLWSAGVAVLFWGVLPGHWRRALAVLSSAAGLVFLVVAMQTQGSRESPTTAAYLLVSPYVTGHATASASLPYYVLTAVCLLLGTAGLAFSDTTARAGAKHWLASAVVVSVGVTLLRFALERVAAAPALAHAVGITWLAPPVGAWFASRLLPAGGTMKDVARVLLGYALLVRGFVVVMMVVATRGRLGSHYDLSRVAVVRNPFGGGLVHFVPGSAAQLVDLALLPQLVFWPVYTVAAGMLGALVYTVISASQQTATAPRAPDTATAAEGR